MNCCTKCLNQVGPEAVFLKNGTYMCPACYQKKYGSKGEPSRSRVDISIEGVVMVVALIGVFVVGYYGYQSYIKFAREQAAQALIDKQLAEASAQKERDRQLQLDVQAERERVESAAKIEAARKDASENAQAGNLDRQNKNAAVKAERERKLAEARELAEKRRLEAERMAHATQEADRLSMAGENSRRRAKDINDVVSIFNDTRKLLIRIDAERTELQRKLTGYKNVLAAAKVNRDALLRQYQTQYASARPEDDDVPFWRNPARAPDAYKWNNPRSVGASPPDYSVLVTKFDMYSAAVRADTANIAKTSDALMAADAAVTDAKARLEDTRQRLEILGLTPEERKAGGIDVPVGALSSNSIAANARTPDATALPAGKSIVLKDGTIVPVLSYFTAEDEVHYRDLDGRAHVVKRDQVDKTQQ